MVWVKVDDRFYSHPKVQAAWQTEPASIGLEMLALSHSGAHLTDGHVAESFVNSLYFRSNTARQRAIAALVDAGLWVPNGDGWDIHDFLKYNESRDVLLARSSAREAKRQSNRTGS